jgi:putative Mn2+ efflux pump MntP
MDLGFMFFFEAVLIGIALAMDAFSVSLANGLNEPGMPKPKMLGVAGMFALFQAAMPLIGWICVKTIVETFGFIEGLLPWITLAVLGFIGAKMLIDSLHPDCDEERAAAGECSMTKPLAFGALVVQAIATSIDALSAGFTISDYNFLEALLAVATIAAVTFPICLGGILIGRKFGAKLSNKAGILGGSILIFIGLEIFITSWF